MHLRSGIASWGCLFFADTSLRFAPRLEAEETILQDAISPQRGVKVERPNLESSARGKPASVMPGAAQRGSMAKLKDVSAKTPTC